MNVCGEELKIGVPVLNRGDLLLRLVESIDVPAEVLVIVNRIGPVDASVEDAVGKLEAREGDGVRVRVERVAGNLGVSGSWNRMMDEFSEGCLICNSDIAFTPGVLRDALVDIAKEPEVVMHHVLAAACFYAGEGFTRTLGWFDENFYPAYREDQEMELRGAALGVRRHILPGLEGRILHGGSETLKSAGEKVRRFIERAHEHSAAYFARRWGAMPCDGVPMPEKRSPFDDPAAHPAAWSLDFAARAEVARLCEEISGHECPLTYYRAEGGLCS